MGQYDEILEGEAFACLSMEKKKLLVEMADMVKGKPAIEAMAILTKYMPMLNQGKPLSDAERNAMIKALELNMNEEERKRLKEIMRIVESMKKK